MWRKGWLTYLKMGAVTAMTDKRLMKLGLVICLVGGLLAGCDLIRFTEHDQIMDFSDAEESSGVDEGANILSGMWMSEIGEGATPDEVVVITDSSFYWLQAQEQSVREEFSDIVSLDMASGHMQVRMRWIRINGQQMGFDSPTYNLSFVQEGDTLRISDGEGAGGRQESGYPDLPDGTFPRLVKQ
jgi:hypothetical protein